MNDTDRKNTGFQKMLFVTKFEELGFEALQSLLVLRSAGLNHVILMNVIERDRVAMHRGLGYHKTEERKLRELANIRFIDWAESLFETGMEVGDYIVVGNMVSRVIAAAEEEDADLIVIGQRSKKKMEFFYSGDDIIELLRRSARPVLIYKHLETSTCGCLPENPFARILLAVDWSPASLWAAEYLKSLKDLAQEISVVHVADPDDLKGSSNMEIQGLRKEKRGRLEQICEALEAAGLLARSHLYVGEPVKEIERAAREFGACMIVMGSSGTSAWTERWLGSTPRAIVEKSGYPVLVIPQPKKP